MRESQVKYREIVENSNDIILMVQDGNLTAMRSFLRFRVSRPAHFRKDPHTLHLHCATDGCVNSHLIDREIIKAKLYLLEIADR